MALCLAWLGIEAYADPSGLWALMAMGVNAWAFWDFFLAKHYPVSSS